MEGVFIESSITFLGTGGDSFVIGKYIRRAGGIVIKVNGNQFHIDPGPGALAAAKEFGISIRENTAVLVSNNSIYSSNDINAVIDGMTYSGFDKKGVLISNKTTVLGSEKERPFLMEFYKNCVERFIVVEAGQKVGVNDVDIIALKTSIHDENSLGFKFITPYYTLGYSSDTNYAASVAEQYKGCDVLILNVPYLTKKEEDNGLSKADAVKIIKLAQPKLTIITHFGAELIKAEPRYEAREIQMETKSQVIDAKDGMVISTGNYPIGQKKKDTSSNKPNIRFEPIEKHANSQPIKEGQPDNQSHTQ